MITLIQNNDHLKLVNDPPELPPYLQKKGPERGGYIILPDLCRADVFNKTQHDNCWTIHYVWMMRVWGHFEKIERTHVNSRVYKRWLETYTPDHNIPPHIQFGGAIVAGEPDPEFYNRWVAYAQETFC